MTYLSLFESFCWGMTGGSTVLITQNGVKLHGYRKARKDDHRRAVEENVSLPDDFPEPDAAEDTGASEDLTPDVVEPIIALRAWRVDHSGSLKSASYEAYWPHREKLQARCSHHSHYATAHEAPGVSCSCGAYAVKRELEMQYSTARGPFCWGRVAIWGRVQEAERGYRAEFAYPVSLTLVNCRREPYMHHSMQGGMTQEIPGAEPLSAEELETLRSQLALHYGVPVRIGTVDELTELRRENYEAMGIPAEVKELVG